MDEICVKKIENEIRGLVFYVQVQCNFLFIIIIIHRKQYKTGNKKNADNKLPIRILQRKIICVLLCVLSSYLSFPFIAG